MYFANKEHMLIYLISLFIYNMLSMILIVKDFKKHGDKGLIPNVFAVLVFNALLVFMLVRW